MGDIISVSDDIVEEIPIAETTPLEITTGIISAISSVALEVVALGSGDQYNGNSGFWTLMNATFPGASMDIYRNVDIFSEKVPGSIQKCRSFSDQVPGDGCPERYCGRISPLQEHKAHGAPAIAEDHGGIAVSHDRRKPCAMFVRLLSST